MGISCFAAGYQLGLYWELTATTTRTARKMWAHQRAAERVGEQGYQKILSIAVTIVAQCANSGGYFVLCSRLSARRVLGAYGHNHENCQNNVKISESSGKSRRTRLSKNCVDFSSGGGAVREFWWVLNEVGISCFAAIS